MILSIPPQTKVFRLRRPDKPAGPWHLTKKIVPNSFGFKSHPIDDRTPFLEAWRDSVTYVSVCGRTIDTRNTIPGVSFDGTLEVSTVAEINKICPSCFPFDTLVMGWGQLVLDGIETDETDPIK